ncbi:MAG: hypothetical protein J6I49_07335 [Bacteroidales bacterium]|nr:hypothetical protein [Bacteroidales bacterium]
MAKLEQGILGPFRGKVGTVVGYLWRGRHVVRAYRKEINYPNTENQRLERDWFVSMVRFAAAARQALLLGMREKAAEMQMTEGNLFVKRNKGCFGRDGSVDYQHLALSSGAVAPVTGAAWSLDRRQVLTCRWDRRSPLPRCKSTDSIHLYVYNARIHQGLLAAPARRAAGSASLALPDAWLPADLHLYLFATSPAGQSSPTAYASPQTSEPDAVPIAEHSDAQPVAHSPIPRPEAVPPEAPQRGETKIPPE